MPNPFTIRIFVPDGDPEGFRIVDRIHSTGKFLAFPRIKWQEIRGRQEFTQPGIYILSGYANPIDELPTIYIGQADVVKSRIEEHTVKKDFWDRAVIFVSADKINPTHAKWLEYALVKKALEAKRCLLDNGNNPKEPSISESEKADMEVFLHEILETLPLVAVSVFEKPTAIIKHQQIHSVVGQKDTIVVPAHADGFQEVFLGQHCWHSVRISGGMLDNIKYVAAYQTAPVSAITHIAEVDRIEPFGDEGKYKLIFKTDAKKLGQPIPYADSPQGMMQGPKYTSIEKLKGAKKVSELFR